MLEKAFFHPVYCSFKKKMFMNPLYMKKLLRDESINICEWFSSSKYESGCLSWGGGGTGGLKKKKKNLLSVAIIAHPLFPRLQIIRFS